LLLPLSDAACLFDVRRSRIGAVASLVGICAMNQASAHFEITFIWLDVILPVIGALLLLKLMDWLWD
jgi:hypothetical protein